MKVHFNIRVSGKVQGVFYRASTKSLALELELSGFVRNEQDGSVYTEIEGETENVQMFIAWCRKGPTHARVDEVDATEGELKNFTEFKISR